MLLHNNRTEYRKRMDGATSMEKELQKKPEYKMQASVRNARSSTEFHGEVK